MKQKCRWGTSNFFSCLFCSYCGSSGNDISAHYTEKHCMEVCSSQLDFDSYEAFKSWKTYISSHSKYTNEWPENKKEMGSNSCFIVAWCGEGRTRISEHPVSTIRGCCPASVRAKCKPDGKIVVDYISTHLGHQDTSEEELLGQPLDTVPRFCSNEEPQHHLNETPKLPNFFSYPENDLIQQEPSIDLLECGPIKIEQGSSVRRMLDDAKSKINENYTESAIRDNISVKVEEDCNLNSDTHQGLAENTNLKNPYFYIKNEPNNDLDETKKLLIYSHSKNDPLQQQPHLFESLQSPYKIVEDVSVSSIVDLKSDDAGSESNIMISTLQKQHVTPPDELVSPSIDSLFPTHCKQEPSVVESLPRTSRCVSERLRVQQELHNPGIIDPTAFKGSKKNLTNPNYAVTDVVVSNPSIHEKPMETTQHVKYSTNKKSVEMDVHCVQLPKNDDKSTNTTELMIYNVRYYSREESSSVTYQRPFRQFFHSNKFRTASSTPFVVEDIIKNNEIFTMAEKRIIHRRLHRLEIETKMNKRHFGTQTPLFMYCPFPTRSSLDADRPRKCYSNHMKKSDSSMPVKEQLTKNVYNAPLHNQLQKDSGSSTIIAGPVERFITPRCNPRNDPSEDTTFKETGMLDVQIDLIEPSCLIHQLDYDVFTLPVDSQLSDVALADISDDRNPMNHSKYENDGRRTVRQIRPPSSISKNESSDKRIAKRRKSKLSKPVTIASSYIEQRISRNMQMLNPRYPEAEVNLKRVYAHGIFPVMECRRENKRARELHPRKHRRPTPCPLNDQTEFKTYSFLADSVRKMVQEVPIDNDYEESYKQKLKSADANFSTDGMLHRYIKGNVTALPSKPDIPDNEGALFTDDFTDMEVELQTMCSNESSTSEDASFETKTTNFTKPIYKTYCNVSKHAALRKEKTEDSKFTISSHSPSSSTSFSAANKRNTSSFITGTDLL